MKRTLTSMSNYNESKPHGQHLGKSEAQQLSIPSPTPKTILKSLRAKKSFDGRIKTALLQNIPLRPTVVTLDKRLAIGLKTPFSSNIILQAEQPKKTVIKKKVTVAKKVNLSTRCKSPQPQLQDPQPVDQTLQRNSSQLKLLYRGSRNLLGNVLVLSSQFFLNEFSFWKQQPVDMTLSKNYGRLRRTAAIIVLVRKQKTLAKLIQFSEKSRLPLDGVFLIEKTHNIQLPINYEPIIKNFSDANTKFTVFGVMNGGDEQSEFYSLDSKLPVTNFRNLTVNLIKTNKDYTPNQLMNYVCQVWNLELTTESLNIDKLLSGYLGYLEKNNVQTRQQTVSKKRIKKRKVSLQKSIEEPEPEQKALKKMEVLKRQWTSDLSKYRYKGPNGQSLQYVIGDILKKNFNLLIDFQKQNSKKAVQSQESTTAATSTTCRNLHNRIYSVCNSIQYNVPVYAVCV